MKKYIAIFTIVITILLIIFINYPNNKRLEIISLDNTISSVLTSEDETVNIPLYFSIKNNRYSDLNNITYASIGDYQDTTLYEVKIEQIYGESKIKKDHDYYEYIYMVKPVIFDDSRTIDIEEAYLTLKVANDEVKVFIGEFSITMGEIQNEEHLDVFEFSGVVNKVNGINTLVGINMGIKNTTSEVITIRDFSFPLRKVCSNMKEVTIIEEGYAPNTNIHDIFDNDNYSYIKQGCENGEVILLEGDVTTFFIPVSYIEETSFLYKSGMKIIYIYEGEEWIYEIDDFIFFDNGFYPDFLDELAYYYEYSN